MLPGSIPCSMKLIVVGPFLKLYSKIIVIVCHIFTDNDENIKLLSLFVEFWNDLPEQTSYLILNRCLTFGTLFNMAFSHLKIII